MGNISPNRNNNAEQENYQSKRLFSWRYELLALYLIGVKPPWILRIFLPKK